MRLVEWAVRRALPCRLLRRRTAWIVAVLTASASALAAAPARAAAAQVAVDPVPPAPARAPAQVAADTDPSLVSLFGRIGGGLLFAEALPMGGFGHAGIEIVISPLGPGYGPFLAVTEQLEIWKTEGAGGVGVPGVVFFGYRLLPLSFGAGIGVNAFTVDWQGEETAFGIYSPRAAARLGLEVGPMYVLAEAEVQRRWRWTLDDITAGQIGLTLGYLLVEDMTR